MLNTDIQKYQKFSAVFQHLYRMWGIWSTWRVNTLHSGSSCEGGGGYPGVIGLRHSIKIDKTFLSPDLSVYFNPIHVKSNTAQLV